MRCAFDLLTVELPTFSSQDRRKPELTGTATNLTAPDRINGPAYGDSAPRSRRTRAVALSPPSTRRVPLPPPRSAGVLSCWAWRSGSCRQASTVVIRRRRTSSTIAAAAPWGAKPPVRLFIPCRRACLQEMPWNPGPRPRRLGRDRARGAGARHHRRRDAPGEELDPQGRSGGRCGLTRVRPVRRIRRPRRHPRRCRGGRSRCRAGRGPGPESDLPRRRSTRVPGRRSAPPAAPCSPAASGGRSRQGAT